MDMEYWIDILKLLGCLMFILLGLLACFVPLPGPLLSWIGVFLLSFVQRISIDTRFIVWSLVVGGVITLMDYIIPIWGTKKFGGTKYGVWGSTVGLIVGLMFTPLGMLLGLILGAFLGEYLHNKDGYQALRSTIGTLVGFTMGVVLKLGYCVVMAYYFFKYAYPLVAN